MLRCRKTKKPHGGAALDSARVGKPTGASLVSTSKRSGFRHQRAKRRDTLSPPLHADAEQRQKNRWLRHNRPGRGAGRGRRKTRWRRRTRRGRDKSRPGRLQMHQRSKRATTPLPRAAPPHRPNAPDGGGNTDGGDGNDAGAINRSTSPLKRLPATAGRRKTKHRFVFRSRKLPVGLRRGKAVLRLSASAPYVMTHHRRVEIHCSIMGYMHGWGGKRGAMRMWNGCARRAWQFALRPFWMRSRACRRRRMCWWSKVRAAFACRWARKVIAHNAEQFTAPPGRLPRPTPQSTAGRARPRAAAGRAAWW